MIRRQHGISLAMVIVVLALLATALLAAMSATRTSDKARDLGVAKQVLQRAADAVDQFAGANLRLPCPANPALGAAADKGLEEFDSATKKCTAAGAQGTLPWGTLGLPRDDSLDPWGRKISYRVYQGGGSGKGSLVVAGSVDMTLCGDDAVGNTTSSGYCTYTGGTHTQTSKFLNGTALTVKEFGSNVDNVAYLVMSHGPTGYGGYTTSGTQFATPSSATEKNNLKDDPTTYTIQAFSGVDVEATDPQHFDDLLLYRKLPDLAKKIGRPSRNWNDGVAGMATFNAATIAAALGVSSVSPGDLGTASLNLGSITATAGSGTNLAYTQVSLTTPAPDGSTVIDSLGVTGASGFFGNFLNNFDNNSLTMRFPSDARKFAITLADFGTYSFVVTFTERVQFTFYDSTGVQVGAPVVKSACRADHGLASYSFSAPGNFRSVLVTPLPATSGSYQYISAFTIAEARACVTSVMTCNTSLADPSNNCP